MMVKPAPYTASVLTFDTNDGTLPIIDGAAGSARLVATEAAMRALEAYIPPDKQLRGEVHSFWCDLRCESPTVSVIGTNGRFIVRAGITK